MAVIIIQNFNNNNSGEQTWTNLPELPLLKFLPMNYYHSHFLATTFDFTSFFTQTFWVTHFIHSLAVLYR